MSLPVVPLAAEFDVLLVVSFDVVLAMTEVLEELFPDPESEVLPDETETLVKYLTLSSVTIIMELL